MKYVVALIGALLLNATANLLMKMGMKTVSRQGGLLRDGVVGALKAVLTSPILLTGLVCFGLNAGLYMYALQSDRLKISIAYPIMVGGGFALISVVAHYHPALLESLNTGQKVGVALVLLGVGLIAYFTGAAQPTV
jgi:small multidrug resistance pump